MTRRAQLVAAATAAFAVANARQNHQRVAALMGCTSSFVSMLIRGRRRLTDTQGQALADGLRDHALRCERLADLIEAEIAEDPRPSLRGSMPRDDRGCFQEAAS